MGHQTSHVHIQRHCCVISKWLSAAAHIPTPLDALGSSNHCVCWPLATGRVTIDRSLPHSAPTHTFIVRMRPRMYLQQHVAGTFWNGSPPSARQNLYNPSVLLCSISPLTTGLRITRALCFGCIPWLQVSHDLAAMRPCPCRRSTHLLTRLALHKSQGRCGAVALHAAATLTAMKL